MYLGVNPFRTKGIFPLHLIELSHGGKLHILRVTAYNFLKNAFLSLKINFVLENSADPDEMPHYAAFHLGLHCLPKYLLRGFWSSRGKDKVRLKPAYSATETSQNIEILHVASLTTI